MCCLCFHLRLLRRLKATSKLLMLQLMDFLLTALPYLLSVVKFIFQELPFAIAMFTCHLFCQNYNDFNLYCNGEIPSMDQCLWLEQGLGLWLIRVG